MKKRKTIILIMMCFVFMMSYSSLLGTSSFNQRLNSFVNENNLSHQDIEHLINEINKMGDSSSNKTLAEELKKIKKKRESKRALPADKEQKEQEKKTIFNPFSIFFNEQNIEFYSNILNIRQKNVNLLDIKIKKGLENNLRIRE